VVIALAWKFREPVAAVIADENIEDIQHSHLGKHLVARAWHVLAIGYLIIVGALWSANTLLGQTVQATAALWSLILVIVFPIVDQFSHAVIHWIFRNRFAPDDPESPAGNVHFTIFLQRGIRILLFFAALVVLAEAWGIGIMKMLDTPSGRAVLGPLFDIVIVIVMACVAWDLFKHFIRHWLPDEESALSVPSDGEGGSGGVTRAETVLPLLRTFVLSLIVVMVIMLILSELGVNIGPLIAGAGVVGLAIGFGAQKLVQDVISGVFFLIDDAFRKGEYIEVNDLRGTVEKISIRSMQLRHHRGPLQTVPFSEIPYIKNHSRDWVIMKLEFRVPYDTNMENLRKLIKRLGQELLEDEELGSSFIEPLKSQGVNRMEHSAMVIRMKFTSVPGEQWVLRREVYRRVQERLLEQGVKFAKPVVSVQIDDESNNRDITSAAAAATSENSLADQTSAESHR
jgi:small-conductance mechanosensitive channel